MYSDAFEQAFGQFLERREYDEAENGLFMIVRAAFAAGWEAAGGKPWKPQEIVRLLPPDGAD